MTAGESVTTVASSDGVGVAVHDLGGSGPPLLLTHATGFHALVWEPLVSHLTGFHCWAPDLRGHGDTITPEGLTFEWRGFADDVLAVVDGLGLEHPMGVGHSKGGAALLLAEQRRPGLFSSLYCFEPVVFPGSFDSMMADDNPMAANNPMAEGARRRRETFASRDEAFANFASKPPFDALDPAALRAYVDHGFADQPDGRVRLKCRPEDEAQVYRMGGRHDAFGHLGEITCPVTIARGAVSGFGPATFAPAIADSLPNGHLVEFADLGHFGPLEDPARVAASITEAFAAA